MSQWIDVNERKPEPNIYCLLNVAGSVVEGWMDSRGGWVKTRNPSERMKVSVTHWMPLPVAPDPAPQPK